MTSVLRILVVRGTVNPPGQRSKSQMHKCAYTTTACTTIRNVSGTTQKNSEIIWSDKSQCKIPHDFLTRRRKILNANSESTNVPHGLLDVRPNSVNCTILRLREPCNSWKAYWVWLNTRVGKRKHEEKLQMPCLRSLDTIWHLHIISSLGSLDIGEVWII